MENSQFMKDSFFDNFFQYDFIVIAKTHMVTHNENQVYDMVMDIMLYAYDKFMNGKYTKNDCFPAWLSKVAYRYVISNYVRDRAYLEPLREALKCASYEEDILSFEKKLSYMEELIENLPLDQRELLELHLHKNTIEEIAVIMGSKRSTIGSKLKKIKRYLKEQMEKAGYINSYKDSFL